MAADVVPVVNLTHVLAGERGTDPFREMDVFLPQLHALGFAGVQNFPTVGLFDVTFRQNLEETDMGYGLEVDLIKAAGASSSAIRRLISSDGSTLPDRIIASIAS